MYWIMLADFSVFPVYHLSHSEIHHYILCLYLAWASTFLVSSDHPSEMRWFKDGLFTDTGDTICILGEYKKVYDHIMKLPGERRAGLPKLSKNGLKK